MVDFICLRKADSRIGKIIFSGPLSEVRFLARCAWVRVNFDGPPPPNRHRDVVFMCPGGLEFTPISTQSPYKHCLARARVCVFCDVTTLAEWLKPALTKPAKKTIHKIGDISPASHLVIN